MRTTLPDKVEGRRWGSGDGGKAGARGAGLGGGLGCGPVESRSCEAWSKAVCRRTLPAAKRALKARAWSKMKAPKRTSPTTTPTKGSVVP